MATTLLKEGQHTGTFRIEILNCTFLESQLHTVLNGEYNDSTSLPVYVQSRVVKGKFTNNLSNDNLPINEDDNLRQFYPGQMPSEQDKPFTSVRHVANSWKKPTDKGDTEIMEDTSSLDDDQDNTQKLRYVTFTYPSPIKKNVESTFDKKRKKEGNKKVKKGGNKTGNAGNENPVDSTSNAFPPLVRLPLKEKQNIVRSSSHPLQCSQSFHLNENTVTELANAMFVFELWAGEDRKPGDDDSSDKFIGSGSISYPMRKLMNSWPEHYEDAIKISGVQCGKSSPRITFRIIPDEHLLNYMRGSRLITIKNPGLIPVVSWVWNVDTESTNLAENKKSLKDSNKNESSFPYPNAKYLMGISICKSDDIIQYGETKDSSTNAITLPTINFHGGKVNEAVRFECSKASGFVGDEISGNDDSPLNAEELSTLPAPPNMSEYFNIISWDKDQMADFFVSFDTVKIWKNNKGKSGDKINYLNLQIQLAKLENGYTSEIDLTKIYTSSLANNFQALDSSGLVNSGTVEIFTNVLPLDSLLKVGAKETSSQFLFQKENHFVPEKKQWLSLSQDNDLIQDQLNTDANSIINYVNIETERRLKANEDDEIDESDLSLENVNSTGKVDPNSNFSRFFLPYNTVSGGGPGNQPILPSQPLNGYLQISINKPLIPNDSKRPTTKNNLNLVLNSCFCKQNENTLRTHALAEREAAIELSNEMNLLKEALMKTGRGTTLQGSDESPISQLNLSAAEYESFRERIKIKMIMLLKAQLAQAKDVTQEPGVTTSLLKHINPLESMQNRNVDLSTVIAHTKRTAKNIVQNVFSTTRGREGEESTLKHVSKLTSQQRLTNGWQALVENVPDRAIKQYTSALGGAAKDETIPDSWYGLAQAHIKKDNLQTAIECLNEALNINNTHTNSLVLRTLVDIELQYSNSKSTNIVITMNSLKFLESVSPTATSRSLLVSLYRLANNDTRAIQMLTGDDYPWDSELTNFQPQKIIGSLHGAARFIIDQNLMKLSSAVLDLARAEERNIDASTSNIYPLARAIRESKYLDNGHSVIAHVRDLKGRHVGLWCLRIAVRASINTRAEEIEKMKKIRSSSQKLKEKKRSKKHQTKTINLKADRTITKELADKKAAESAAKAAKNANYKIVGGLLDVQQELEYLTNSTRNLPVIEQLATKEGKVRFALAQFRRNNNDDKIQSLLIEMADKGNRTGVLWSRDRASTYMLAWRAMENVNEHPSTSKKIFEFLVRESSALAGAWMGLGLCQMYDGDYNSAQKHFERACTLDSSDIRNWLGLGCNALCRGVAGLQDADQCARRIEELGEMNICKETSTVCTLNLFEDFTKGLFTHKKAKHYKVLSRMRDNTASTINEKERPSTTPTPILW
jgi:tetratricopeptide (TPR) repeat protein